MSISLRTHKRRACAGMTRRIEALGSHVVKSGSRTEFWLRIMTWGIDEGRLRNQDRREFAGAIDVNPKPDDVYCHPFIR